MENVPNVYYAVLFNSDGRIRHGSALASSAQEAADKIRRDWEGYEIHYLALAVYDWK